MLRFLYLLALILTTTVTNGISKSLCRVCLETYQVALLIVRSIFDWNVWSILVLDGLVHPGSSIPYVHMGRSIALYRVSLLSRDSCERVFLSQLMFFSLNCSWHRLVLCASSMFVLLRDESIFCSRFAHGIIRLFNFLELCVKLSSVSQFD